MPLQSFEGIQGFRDGIKDIEGDQTADRKRSSGHVPPGYRPINVPAEKNWNCTKLFVHSPLSPAVGCSA